MQYCSIISGYYSVKIMSRIVLCIEKFIYNTLLVLVLVFLNVAIDYMYILLYIYT